MIFFFKADGTLIKSAPETVYQGSAEAGKVYVVAPLNANMLVDVYYELPNGERWGAYLLENNGTVINNEELPDGWALWSTTLESAITQYAGDLKAQFGFYQSSGNTDKVPLITSQGVTIKIAKGVVRDLPSAPTTDVYAQIVNAISSIKQDIANLPNEYLSNTNEDKIALKNNGAVEYSENATAGTIARRDSDGKINVADGTEDLNAVNVGQLNAALEKKVDDTSVSSAAVKGTIAKRTETGQLKAADGVADDDLATVKQLNAAQGNYTDITNIDLNTGDTTVEYDTGLGITVNAKGTVTHKNGDTEQPTTKFELPIAAGDGIVIDKAQNEEKINVKVDGEVMETPNSIVKRDSAGRVKTADAVSDEDAASYGQQKALRNYTDAELLKKLDRTGGTITGNLIVSGNLSVSGETSVIESTTLKVADKLIYVAKDNTSALTSPAGLITPKYDGTNDGGLVYDNSGTAYVGDITLDSKGNVNVNASDLQPIATRDNYSNFTNGHKVKVEVDSSQKNVKFVDGGKDDGINSLTDVNLTLGNITVQYDITDGIQINSTARFTAQGTNHDAMMDLAIPIIGTDAIVIDKAADSKKIEISGKNFVKKAITFDLSVYGLNTDGDTTFDLSWYGNCDSGNIVALSNLNQPVPGHPDKYTGDEIPVKNATVLVPEPTRNYHAANKKYVDDGFIPKPASFSSGSFKIPEIAYNDEILYVTVESSPVVESIAQRTPQGTLRTNNPTADLDAANKKYVDDNIAAHLVGVYTYKGSKDTYANLPATGNNVGDVWNVEDTGTNYAWNGTNWDSLSANVLDSTGNSTVQAMSQKATTDELNKKVNTSDNFVKAFTIPSGVRTGTLTSDVKQKLCNPDGHNYYVYDDNSEMILKYSFNEEDEIIQYKAVYFVNDKAYDITMQILPSNGSWRRSQTVLNGATANPTLTGMESELTSLTVGGTDYKIPIGSGGEAVTPSTATSTATSGTFTSAEWAKLQESDNNYILFNNEIYRLADKAHSGTTGIWSYTHTGWDGTNVMDKSINVTVSTGAWTLVIGSASAGGKLYRHSCIVNVSTYTCNLTFFDYQSTPHTIESAFASPRIGYSLSATIDMKVYFGIIDSFADNGYVQWYFIQYRDAMTGSSVDTYSVISIFGQQITSLTDTVTEL